MGKYTRGSEAGDDAPGGAFDEAVHAQSSHGRAHRVKEGDELASSVSRRGRSAITFDVLAKGEGANSRSAHRRSQGRR